MFGLIPLIAFILMFKVCVAALDDREGGRREAFVLASVIWGFCVVVSTEVLNLFQAINFVTVCSFWLLVIVVFFFLQFKYSHPNNLLQFFPKDKIYRIEIITLFMIVFIVLLVGMVAFMAPPNSWDALNYHMTRVMFWEQNQSVNHYPTPEFRQLFIQPWAGFSFLHFQILSGTDRFAPLVSWFSFLGSVLGVSLITLLFGGNRRAQIFSALCAAAIPTAIIEASAVRIDMIVAFWLVCFVALMLRYQQIQKFYYIFFLGLTLGLSILTKGTTYLLAPPFILWFVWIVLRKNTFFNAVRIFALFGLLTIVLNLGFYSRNYVLTGDPLGPEATRKWGTTEDMNPARLVACITRAAAFQLGNELDVWNNFIIKSVDRIHEWINVDIIDDKITHVQTRFYITTSTHEDGVTNFIQAMLMLITFPLGIALALRRKQYGFLVYIITVSLSFVILVGMIVFTNHLTRYNLPVFVLASVVFGLLFREEFKWKTVISYIVVIVLFATAVPYVFKNNLRKIASMGKATIFNRTRLQLYFRNDSMMLEPYTQALQHAVDRNCDQIGLNMLFNYWDYPFWVIWQQELKQEGRIEHINYNHMTPGEYLLGSFQPCAVIAVDYNDKTFPNEIQFANQLFLKVKNFTRTAVYEPVDPIYAQGPLVPNRDNYFGGK